MPVRMSSSIQAEGSGPVDRRAVLRAEVADATGSMTITAAIERYLAQAGEMLGAWGEVRVRIVGDAEMARAHEEFTGVPGTTDVLTFDMTDAGEAPGPGPSALARDGAIAVLRARRVDADILACADEAHRQAAARGHAVRDEVLLYALHGLLHCLGHDDHDPEAYAAMHALEDAVLRRLGVGAVFGLGGRGAG